MEKNSVRVGLLHACRKQRKETNHNNKSNCLTTHRVSKSQLASESIASLSNQKLTAIRITLHEKLQIRDERVDHLDTKQTIT